MDETRKNRAYELFEQALERESDERSAFLEESCAGDAVLRRLVDTLLAADAEAGSFLEVPPSTGDLTATLPAVDRGVRPETLPAEAIPLYIGKYRITRVIASGGMGTVYEAVQEKPRRSVAVKVMKQGIASRSTLRRFEYESQALARLRHPCIAQIYEAGTHRGDTGTVPYFAMEYIPDAKTITQYVQERKLGTRDRMRLFSQCCDAVHHGHQKGVIHRDLKPSNILVDAAGCVKIIDFGVARSTDSDMAVTTMQTDVGQIIGTLQYMSPEQCAADPHDIDTRSDVYGLGVVFYELLTGRLPYDVSNIPIHRATEIIREQAPTRPSAGDRTLRGDVETIALMALEKDRARRYQSAADFSADIHRYLNNEAIAARPPSMVYQVRVFARRHKSLVGAIVTIMIVLAGATVFSTVQYFKADRARVEAIAARDEAERARQEEERTSNDLLATRNYFLPIIENVGRVAIREGDIPGRDLLTRFSRDLDSGVLKDTPLVEATLRITVGRFHRPFDMATADHHMETALAIRRRELGNDHWDTLRAMQALALNYKGQERFDEAEALYREALPRQLEQDPGHYYTHLSASGLFGIYRAQERTAEIEQLMKQVLQAFPENVEPYKPLYYLQRLLHAMHAQGKIEESHPFVQRLIALCKEVPKQSVAYTEDLHYCARSLLTCEPVDLQDPEAALSAALRAAEMTENKVPAVLDTLAMAHFKTGNAPDAVRTLAQALELVPADAGDFRSELEQRLATYREAAGTTRPGSTPVTPSSADSTP